VSHSIFLCAISNISSGHCNEDCGYCTQSVKHNASIQRYYHKNIDQIVQEAKMARDNQAVGFCLVTSTKALDSKTLAFVQECAQAVKKAVPELSLIACNGIADYDSLCALKDAGIENYNHNLESSKEFYPHICSTHTWQERYQTCLDAKRAGLHLCVGGIFGLGESIDDRHSMLQSIASLAPLSTPINFYHPNPNLPIKQEVMRVDEALEMVSLCRKYLPDVMLMIAGGREITFGARQGEIFDHGANAIVVGDYLTTGGQSAQNDILMIQELGYSIANSCH
jgi:biotin synthase